MITSISIIIIILIIIIVVSVVVGRQTARGQIPLAQ